MLATNKKLYHIYVVARFVARFVGSYVSNFQEFDMCCYYIYHTLNFVTGSIEKMGFN